MFSAFSITGDDYSKDLQAEIMKNSYTLPILGVDLGKTNSKVKIDSKSFHGKSSRSFYGCAECKKRKKKCNEVRPSCALCIKRGTSCVYRSEKFRRRPNPTYKNRSEPPTVSGESAEGEFYGGFMNDISVPADVLPEMDWSSSASPTESIHNEEVHQNDLETFLDSILSEFPYSHPDQDQVLKPSLMENPDTSRREEVIAMDESQVIQNIDKNGDDDLVMQFISNVKSHGGTISDEELSKYITSGSDDFITFKRILYHFLQDKNFPKLDDLDRFYMSSFVTSVKQTCSFSSTREKSFCDYYLDLAKTDDGVAFALVAWGSGHLSNKTSQRAQDSLKRSLDLYGESLSRFLIIKQKTGEIDHGLTISITTSLVIFSHVGIMVGNIKEWMQYHGLLKNFLVNHFGGVAEFVRYFKKIDPQLTKIIATHFFCQGALTVTNIPTTFESEGCINAVTNSRLSHTNEFDSVMGYCTGLYIVVAQIREYCFKHKTNMSKFEEFDTMLVEETPVADHRGGTDGLSEEQMEQHMTFFEVQQISARLYLRLLFKCLDPREEETNDMLLNLMGSMQILLKTPFETFFSFSLLMCGIAVVNLHEERVFKNIIAHVKSHNQAGNVLRSCMFVDEMWKYDRKANRHEVYQRTLQDLNWDISLCC